MRLVSFERGTGRPAATVTREAVAGRLGVRETLETPPAEGVRAGALFRDRWGVEYVADLNRCLALRLAAADAGAPDAVAQIELPSDLRALLARDPSLGAAREALAFARSVVERDGAQTLETVGAALALQNVRLRAPVPRPGKILGVARNYQSHAREQGQRETPTEPVLFVKASSAVIGNEDPIELPAVSREVDYEGELAVVIGRPAKGVAPADAAEHIAGFTVANDVSARDFQNVRGQRFVGKSCDTFAPLGPALVTPDELPDPQSLAITTVVSGVAMQRGNTGQMTFPIAELIAFASRLMTLEPGDVLLTGTPSGVGRAQKPPRYLRHGDRVEVTVEGVGTLGNPVRASAEGPQAGA